MFLGITWFYDFTSRILLNDVSLHCNHFYWTSLTYLGPFFLIQVCIGIFFINVKYFSIVLILLHFYLVEISDFLISNYTFSIGLLDYYNFNNLLTNNLNKYHPHIFYISTILFILIVAVEYLYHSSKITFFCECYIFKIKSQLLLVSSYCNVFALFLGSWWAFQEGTWGGWWNWDPSEVLGLLIFLIVILTVHQFASCILVEYLFIKIRLGVTFFVLVYFFTQLNFDLVSHNFGNRFTFFFTNTLFYFESVILLTIIISITTYLYYWQIFQYSHTLGNNKSISSNPLFIISLSLLWVITICISFIPLCNYFLWQYLHINMLNSNFMSSSIFYVTILSTWVVFHVFQASRQVTIGLFLTTIASTPTAISSFTTRLNLSSNSLFHKILIIGVTLNLILNQLPVSNPLIVDNKTRVFLEDYILQSPIKIYLCESSWREFYYCSFLPNNSYNMCYSISNKLTTLETSTFLFFQNNSNFINFYKLFDTYLSVSIILDNFYFSVLYEATLILVIIYVVYTYSKTQLHV